MSAEKLRAEARRWITTAREDLNAARLLSSNGMYSLACFHTQQAGEKAVKALHYLAGLDPWGHSVGKLITDLAEQAPEAAAAAGLDADSAVRLDQFYIPTRYPNGIPDIAPPQAFRERDAAEGLAIAERIVSAVEKVAEAGRSAEASSPPGGKP